jgi:hypothetical protein
MTILVRLLLFFLASTPEQRAVDYLSHEVPNWHRDNRCFSCHNNGDAARALFLAAHRGYAIKREVVADTVDWLSKPADWENNHGNPGFSNTKLARIQFAAALTDAHLPDSGLLIAAAESLLPLQEKTGEWRIATGGLPGAPAIYGTSLATYMARRTLETADAKRFAEPVARANRWLMKSEPENLLDAAVMLLALPSNDLVRRKCVERLVAAQTSDGGWGPQPRVPAEVFDTAAVMIALDAAGVRAPLARSREYLLKAQQPAGGWPETTRPAGNTSYAEHISTTGWALYALLTVRPEGK